MSLRTSNLFECLAAPQKKLKVYKSTVTNDFIIMDGNEEVGIFRKGEGRWYYYDGLLLRIFEALSDLFDFVGEQVEEQA